MLLISWWLRNKTTLQRFHGQPLYRWRLDAGDFLSLETALREDLNAAHPFDDVAYPLEHVRSMCAASFVIWAAEWYRREFDGGSFRYPLEELGILVDVFDEWILPSLAGGFQKLGRVVIQNNDGYRAFLYTIVREAGILLNVLANRRGHNLWLSEFLDALLERRRGFPLADLLQYAATIGPSVVPKRLDTPEMRGNACALVDAITEARAAILAGTAASDLLANRAWAARLPFPTDDPRALEGVLKNWVLRSAAFRSTEGVVPTVRFELQRHGEVWSLRRVARMRRRISKEHFAELFGLDPARPPPYVAVQVRAASGDRQQLCEAVLLHGSGEYRLDSQDGDGLTLRSDLLDKDLELVAHSGGRDIGIAGGDHFDGEAPEPEVPWIFRADEDSADAWRLVATGSRRLRHGPVLVLRPSSLELSESAGTAPCLLQGEPRRTLHRVAERAVFVHGESRFEIKISGEDHDESAAFKLRASAQGGTTTTDDGGQVHFIGAPELWYRASATAPLAQVDATWTPDNAGARIHGLQSLGEGWLRVWSEDGFIRFARRMSIVPRGFSIGLEAAGARVRVRAAQEAEWTVDGAPASGLEAALPSREGLVEIAFSHPSGATWRWRILRAVASARFVTKGGTILAAGSGLGTSRLSTVRAEVVPETPTAVYALNARFAAGEHVPADLAAPFRDWRRTWRLERNADGICRLDLERIRPDLEWLVRSVHGHDASVHLRLERIGGAPLPGGPHALVVRPYEGEMRVGVVGGDEFSIEARPYSRISTPVASLELQARSFTRLSERPLTLQSHDGAGWMIASGTLPAGPWLLSLWNGVLSDYRPRLIWLRPRDAPPAAASGALERATNLRMPGERMAAIVACMNSRDPSIASEALTAVATALEACRQLPPSTFDVLLALPQAPSMAVAALLTSSSKGEMIVRIEDIPGFAWHLVPVEAWTQGLELAMELVYRPAGALVSESVRKLLPEPEELRSSDLQQLFAVAASEPRVLIGLAAGAFACGAVSAAEFGVRVAEAKRNLHRDAAEAWAAIEAKASDAPQFVPIGTKVEEHARAAAPWLVTTVPRHVTATADRNGHEWSARSLWIAPRLAAHVVLGRASSGSGLAAYTRHLRSFAPREFDTAYVNQFMALTAGTY